MMDYCELDNADDGSIFTAQVAEEDVEVLAALPQLLTLDPSLSASSWRMPTALSFLPRRSPRKTSRCWCVCRSWRRWTFTTVT